METKIENLLSIGNEIISKVYLNAIKNSIRVHEDCCCENGCDPIDGWMLSYIVGKDVDLKPILNELCVCCEKMGVEYELDYCFNKNNDKINIWVTNSVIGSNRLARRVFKWNNTGVKISNSPCFVELNSSNINEAIKYNDIQILSVLPPQLN